MKIFTTALFLICISCSQQSKDSKIDNKNLTDTKIVVKENGKLLFDPKSLNPWSIQKAPTG